MQNCLLSLCIPAEQLTWTWHKSQAFGIEIIGHSYRLPFSFSPFLLPFTGSKSLATTRTFRNLCNLSLGIVKRYLHRIFTAFDSLHFNSGLYHLIGAVSQRLVAFCQRSLLLCRLRSFISLGPLIIQGRQILNDNQIPKKCCEQQPKSEWIF